MAGSCCSKPVARIIKVGATEAGIIGLDVALKDVLESLPPDDTQTADMLLSRIKKFGNYVAPGLESAYREALLREFKQYCARASQGT